jgi:hypothetical protein
MDARQVVFSNYFVANKRFWNRWLELCEGYLLFAKQMRRPWLKR